MEANLSHRHSQHKKDLLELLQQPAFQDIVQARDQKEVQDALKEAKASEQVFLSVAGLENGRLVKQRQRGNRSL